MKKGFTLMEVTLAMLVMAVAILSITGLYSFGYRENRQSREDVASAAYADAVISPLVMACLTTTNLSWNTFRNDEFCLPDGKGWGAYLDGNYQVSQDPSGKAGSAYATFIGKLSGKGMSSDVPSSIPDRSSDTGLRPALVIRHEANSPVVQIGFRAVPQKSVGQLFMMPTYYTEVRIQGFAE